MDCDQPAGQSVLQASWGQSRASPSWLLSSSLEQGLREGEHGKLVEEKSAPEWKELSGLPGHPADTSAKIRSGQISVVCWIFRPRHSFLSRSHTRPRGRMLGGDRKQSSCQTGCVCTKCLLKPVNVGTTENLIILESEICH